MIPCLAAAGVLFTRLCTRPSIPRLEQALASTVLLYADCSTLMVGRPVTVTMKKKRKLLPSLIGRIPTCPLL